MGRIKDILLQLEFLEVMYTGNENLREYLLTIESEFIPEANEQDNYYLLKYCLLDLRSLTPITISEKVKQDQIELEIPNQLAKIIHETNFSISESNKISYKALINNGWTSVKYLFQAIPINESINSLDDLVILPSSANDIKHHLFKISESLEDLNSVIYEMGNDTNTNLTNIEKELDLMNYLAQS